MEACLYKDPVRNDIIKEYSDYLHEKICEDIKTFWDKNYEKINVNNDSYFLLIS